MMHPIKLVGALLLLLLHTPATAEEIALEEVLKGYRQAIGGAEALAAVERMKILGTFSFNGLDQPFMMYRARPGTYHLEVQSEHGDAIEAYDGETALITSRSGEVRTLKGAPRELMIEEFGNFDGPLINPEKPLELVGSSEFDSAPVWHIRVLHSENRSENWYLLKETFLPIKRTLMAEHRRAGTFERVWYYLEYQRFEGKSGLSLVLPSYFEREDRQHVRAFTVERVLFNSQIDEALSTAASQ